MTPAFKLFTAITLFFCGLAAAGTLEYETLKTEEEATKHDKTHIPDVVPAPIYKYLDDEDL